MPPNVVERPLLKSVPHVFGWGPLPIFPEIQSKFFGGSRSSIVCILGYIRGKVRVQAVLRPFTDQASPHEIADQQVIKTLIVNRLHQRVPRNLKPHPGLEPPRAQFNDVIAAPHPE